MSSILEEVLASNVAYSSNFGAKTALGMAPARGFAILTCMDARLDPAKFAGLSEGDAHVIRNAGGRATDDAILSLVISHRLGGTREWFVIHHSNCGLETIAEEEVRRILASSPETPKRGEPDTRLAAGKPAEGGGFDWLTIRDTRESVAADVKRIRSHALVPRTMPIHGYVYDVRTGRLNAVSSSGALEERS